MDVRQYAQQEKYFLVGVFLLSLVLRFALFAGYTRYDDHAWLAFDSEQYHTIALQIVDGKGISNQDRTPNFYRLPAYPLFLAACYKIFNKSTQVALWLQLILASIIPVLIFFFALTLFPGNLRVAKMASVVAALHTGFIMYAGILSTESLFLLFFLLFLIYFYSGLEVLHTRLFFYAGMFLGVASLIRPVGHYLVVVALGLLCARRIRCGSILRDSCVFLAGWLVMVSPWLIRNYLLAGALFFHTLPGLHFLQYSAVAVEQDRLGCDYFQARDRVFAIWQGQVAKQEKLLNRPATEHERFAIAQKVANYYLRSYPVLFFKHACTQIARTCGTLYSTLLLYVPLGTVYGGDASLWFKIKLYLFPRAMHSLLVPLIYWEMISYLLVLLGCFLFFLQALCVESLRWVLIKTVPFMGLLVFITLAYGCARLRFAVEPFMIVLASYAWNKLYAKLFSS